MRFTRMTQACNREEARVSYLWNAMNLLSLGLMVCVAAFGIISVNNYHKMKDMENKIAYIMSMPQEALAAMSGQLYEEKGTWEEQLDNVVQTQDTTETTQEEDSLQKQAQLMQTTESCAGSRRAADVCGKCADAGGGGSGYSSTGDAILYCTAGRYTSKHQLPGVWNV